jgi:D-glycerate 3-kinase
VPFSRLVDEFVQDKGLTQGFAETAERYYLPLLALLNKSKQAEPLLIGINGAQGSGKSTLAEFLAYAASELFEWQVTCLSLDDIYHTKAERQRLAREIHPLLVTRGVPGTHDLELGETILKGLVDLTSGDSILVPRFNKAVDDQYPSKNWDKVTGKQDLIIFEGWCLGCLPQEPREISRPLNELEKTADEDCRWRNYVNTSIEEYQSRLWSRLHMLVMLKVPSFEQVFIWRSEQEQKLVESLGHSTELSDPAKMKYFISHYERLTRHMLDNLPKRAEVVMRLNENHQVYSVEPDLPTIEIPLMAQE